MTNAQRNITTLLAVIAVLLGLNMLVRGSPSVEAQMTGGPAERTVVAGAVAFPAIARGANSTQFSRVALLLRFWSDGVVDGTRVYSQRIQGGCGGAPPTVCDGPTTLIPSSCPADINLDRNVGVGDMLDVFAQWGPCE